MSIGGYPIYSIHHSISWAKEQGYKIWHWHTGGNAMDCPLEPFTPDFWQQKRDSRLAYGLHLPQFSAQYGGDLLILVTQRLDRASQKDFGGWTARQRTDVYGLILEINYMHVTVVRTKPPKQQVEFFQACEDSFATLLPKRNANGEYYREAKIESAKLEILQPNDQGGIICPKCRRSILFGDGLWVMEKRMEGDNTMVVSALCEYCGALSEIQIEELDNRYEEFIAQLDT